NLQADHPGTFHGLSAHFSGDGFPGMSFDVQAVPPQRFADWVRSAHIATRALDAQSYGELEKQSLNVRPFTYSSVEPGLFQAIATQKIAPAPGPQSGRPNPSFLQSRSAEMLGKLSWAAIPFDQPIPMIASAVVTLVILGVIVWVIAKGWLPYLWNEWITSVDHKRI